MTLRRWSFLEKISDVRIEDKICAIFVVGVKVPIGTIFFTFSTKAKGIEVVVYEPALKEDNFYSSRVIRDLDEFKEISDIIVANRWSDNIKDVKDKVYTRDLYCRD